MGIRNQPNKGHDFSVLFPFVDRPQNKNLARGEIDAWDMRILERDELGLPLALKSDFQQIARAEIMHGDNFTDYFAVWGDGI